MIYTPVDSNVWTPKIVGEILIEMTRWLTLYGGHIGPSRLRSAMPELHMELADRLGAGWSSVQENEVTSRRRSYRPYEVSLFERAIEWQGAFLIAEQGAARVLALWLRCKISKLKFDAEIKRRGWSRGTAYRKRDQALSAIALGLTRTNENFPPRWR